LNLRATVDRRMSLDPLLLGSYAWFLTVGVPAFSPGAPLTSRIVGGVAITVLWSGWLVAHRYPNSADVVVVAGFLGLCFVTWLTLGHARLTSSQAELRTVLGAAAWSLFGISWVRSRYSLSVRDFTNSIAVPSSTFVPNRKSNGWFLKLTFSPLLVFAVFLKLGIPKGDGRGVLVTAVALAWSLWFVTTSGALAERYERHAKGLGLGLIAEPSIVLAIVMSAAGVIMSILVKP